MKTKLTRNQLLVFGGATTVMIGLFYNTWKNKPLVRMNTVKDFDYYRVEVSYPDGELYVEDLFQTKDDAMDFAIAHKRSGWKNIDVYGIYEYGGEKLLS